MANDRTFEIGFVMAGAISAGAYTAGVMDFIFEALDAYESAKSSPGWDGPTHDVRVPVMAGASAGGMTSAISALHAYYDLKHVWPGAAPPSPERNRLYSSWVTDISLDALLATTDLEGGREAGGVLSLLCCDILDQIVDSAFVLGGSVRQRNWVGRDNDRTLRVMLTLTNVRGVPYSFAVFGANSDERLGMLNHADYYDFAVGTANAAGGTLALNVEDFANPAWTRYKTAALATGAFPVGLRPRIIERSDETWYSFAGCVGYEDATKDCFVPIAPDSSFTGEAPYRFATVDGGTIDNEPLELARRYLAGRDLHNPRDGQAANKAVVLVAPFPNFETAPPFSDALRLIDLLPRVGSALIDQARFKPDELELAANDTVFSRFMISPIRNGNGSDAARKYPIACGVMGGFGGFIDQSFRRHDYLLGRRNAQAFLRWNFALPDSNPMFDGQRINAERWRVRNAEGEAGSLDLAGDRALKPKMFSPKVAGGVPRPGLPIIPLVDDLCKPIEIGAADLPRPREVPLAALKEQIRARAKKVIGTLLEVDLHKEVSSIAPIGVGLATEAVTDFAAHVATEKAFAVVQNAVNEVAAAFA
ncbi:patatin-like phospholipase family protein [Roseiarcus sp.]|uniref:patatin-like phospholipase family protein n=1 Tax=Roseiarcus sp. TaxID=1969460 RepID=UPI003F9DE2BA